ncbi:ankyrin repeat domain-containing protein [Burkholderia cenocepacia]|uniref:ankyrin repeat domain-containing protein n=1 Tax=Burkholderia cenocepacia TaxID=95486 RepID=UPI002237867A|nr:ankyrin repeat domain-containing protein [Burkholderia cenocepacia]MCW5156417.1 ankyrin repeat domain-containing protein [Burkholderia cenocepacia]
MDWNEKLIEFSKEGNLEGVKEALSNGADIHAASEEGEYEGRTDDALVEAAENGHLEVVNYLIDQGANIHAEDDSALIYSAYHGHLPVVQYLVERGANIHALDDRALYWSAYHGHLPVVQYLVEQGANIHARDDGALQASACNGHLEVVQYLVELGCDPQIVIDYEDSDKSVKEWAEKYINARDLSNKLDNNLADKPLTKAQKLSNDIESEDFVYQPTTTKSARTKL